jgi:predicted ATPase/class 3 adenylate cyclase/Tfp pilus assembly protein PilF
MEPPTGTVTFLFTDIEGSARLWEEQPEAMREALVRHEGLLHEAIGAHQGYVFKLMGDQFCVAFGRPTDALASALGGQRALQAEPWEVGPLKVRMALHTGEAEARGGDYFGPPLNRCARLLAAGHGGQVLLSHTAAHLVRDALPEGAQLRPLGEHRLRDLTQPEDISQLLHPDLPSDFPPLRSLAAFAHNLPLQLTSFVGREEEVAEVKRLLRSTRLLTLTGTGGAGKTRLALQVGADLLDGYPDGVWLVELAALTEAPLIPQAVLSALGLREEPQRPLTDTLVDSLRPKHALLILDNCEHVVQASAELAEQLLRSCPQVRILATSREVLRAEGEAVWRVPSLSLPSREAETPPVEQLTQYEAVRLFIDRAIAANSQFQVTNDNAPAVAEVCWRLDGIPLAIELAAARTSALSAEEIERRLDDRFRLLTGGRRTAMRRHQTLRAAVEWSYDLLDGQERRLFERLSVFVGGFTLEAAEAVCVGDGIGEGHVLDLVDGLVSKSLVAPVETDYGARYRMLESLRAYGEERLQTTGDGEAAWKRHREFFAELAERAKPELAGPQQATWLARLDADHGNLRAAFARPGAEGAATRFRLVSALRPFWFERGSWSEGADWAAQCLAGKAEVRDELRADALICGGIMAYYRADYQHSTALFEEALELSRRIGYQASMANALDNLGNIAQRQGDYATARTRREEALAIRRDIGDREAIAVSLHNLGWMANELRDYVSARACLTEALDLLGDARLGARTALTLNLLACVADREGKTDEARELFGQSLALWRETGNEWGAAQVLINLGVMADSEGDLAQARALYTEALTVHQRAAAKLDIAICLCNLAGVSQQEGDYGDAERTYKQALRIAHGMADPAWVLTALEGLGSVARSRGNAGRGAQLLGACQSIREAVGLAPTASSAEEYRTHAAAAREALGHHAFEAAWAEGQAMTLDEAVAYALEGPDDD